MGTMKEDFHSRGTRSVEMERLNIRQRGVAMQHLEKRLDYFDPFLVTELHRTIDDLQLRCPNWVKVTQSFLQC